MDNGRLAPFDYDECGFYLECVSDLAMALHDAIVNDPNEGPNFGNAAYGIKLLVDYINVEVREAARREAREHLNRMQERDGLNPAGSILPPADV